MAKWVLFWECVFGLTSPNPLMEKEWTVDAHYNMENLKTNMLTEKSDAKDFLLYDPIYRKCLTKANL